MNRILHLIIIFNSFLVFACSSKPETYTVEVIDGVRHVHNLAPKWSDVEKIELEFIQKIGDAESEDDNYNLYQVVDIVKDDEGNYYIVDAGNSRIQKFDSAGKYLLSIGKKGQGPGEFSSIGDCDVSRDGFIYVWNGMYRMEIFDFEGNLIESKKFEKISALVKVFNSGRLLTQFFAPPTSQDEIMGNPLFNISDRHGNILKNIGAYDQGENIRITNFLNIIVPVIDRKDNIYLNYPFQNRIEKYSPEGELKMRVDRTLNYEVKHKAKIRTFETQSGQVHWPDAEMTYVSNEIGIDNKSRIWVTTYTSQEETNQEGKVIKPMGRILEIFDLDGILLGQIDLPEEYLRFMGIEDSRILFSNKDRISVYEYRIVER
ncbi:6-bladed beta-propeller [candidate division KSB1 bacterium]